MASTSYIELLFISVLLILPFLYETSHVFRYYFKFFIYYSFVMFNSVILIPYMCFWPSNVKNLLTASLWCHNISWILGLRWELRGREHLQKEQACVVVANHQSSLDILGMFDIWPVMDKCTVVAKKELLYAWPFGLAAWLCGLVFIDRMNSDKARNVLNDATENIKRNKIKLWVFPEGTRHNTGSIHTFKKGAFHVAISAQLPILPVVFSSYQHFLDDDKKILNSGRVVITTLPPISTEGLTISDIDHLMEITHKAMSKMYTITTNEVQASIANLRMLEGYNSTRN